MNPSDIHYAILGGGLLGRLFAWRLLESGVKVSIFDKDLSGNKSAGLVAAAMMAPISEALEADPVLYFQGKKSLSIWHQWLEDLNATQSVSVDFSMSGSIFVSHQQDSHLYAHLMHRLSEFTSIDTDDYQHLESQALYQLEPELAKGFSVGCLLKPEGYLDNSALYLALKQRIDDLGGQWIHYALPSTLSEIKKLADFNPFSRIIDCRGLGARDDLSSLRGVRGEVIRVSAPDVNLTRPIRLMHPRYKLYIAPRPNCVYVIGATQIESDSEAAVTVRSSLELLSALYSIHPGFAEANILSQDARCRPAFNDNLPRIECHGDDLAINGLYRHGYLLGPSVITQALHVLGLDSQNSWPEILTEKND